MATDILSREGEPLLTKFDTAFSISEATSLPSSGSKSALSLSDSPQGDSSEPFTSSVDDDLESESEEEEEDDEDEDDYDPLEYFQFDESDNELSNELLCKELPKYTEKRDDWPDTFTFKDSLEYSKELNESNGFDVKVFRVKDARIMGLIQPALSKTTKDINNIANCAKAAVKRENIRRRLYNKDHDIKLNDHLRLKGVTKAMSQQICGRFIYFLTINVLEGEQEMTYETMICLYPRPSRGEWGKFRVKGTRVRFVGEYERTTYV